MGTRKRPKIKLIGLCGRAGAGKSESARLLVEGYGFIRQCFSSPIKQMLEVLGVEESALYGNKKEGPSKALRGVSARYAMQTLGTEWGRKLISPDLWTACMERSLKHLAFEEGATHVVIDDCRFADEAELVWKWGGSVWEIVRGMDYCHIDGTHESEQRNFQPDIRILNDGDVHDLEEALDIELRLADII